MSEVSRDNQRWRSVGDYLLKPVMERHDSKKVRHSMSMSFKGGRRQEIILNNLKTYNYSSVDTPGNYWELGTAFLQLSSYDRGFEDHQVS